MFQLETKLHVQTHSICPFLLILLAQLPMALFIVATPIGHSGDFSDRALQTLKQAQFVIGEEAKVTRRQLKEAGAWPKEVYELNEHSSPEDVQELLELCRTGTVALVSDCGTPGFSDPGPQLVAACRAEKISVSPVPGPSSLTTILSMTSQPIREFVFAGFLPANREKRQLALKKYQNEKRSLIFMDTPYRLKRLLSELAPVFPNRTALLGLDMTSPDEAYLEDKISKLESQLPREKAEFMLLVY